MKKIIVLLVILLGLSLMAYSAAEKIPFLFPPAPDGEEVAEGCFAIVNYTPKDAADEDNVNDTVATIQIQVRGLEPGEYGVFSSGPILGTFTTNKQGSGSFHYNVTEATFEDLTPRYIGIWDPTKTTLYLWLEI